ncbi:MAG: hypothetical protein JWM77_1901 [Rhodospirillales bacterium]|nr:hypothetical protein [Rhodospirillales bacterium]
MTRFLFAGVAAVALFSASAMAQSTGAVGSTLSNNTPGAIGMGSMPGSMSDGMSTAGSTDYGSVGNTGPSQTGLPGLIGGGTTSSTMANGSGPIGGGGGVDATMNRGLDNGINGNFARGADSGLNNAVNSGLNSAMSRGSTNGTSIGNGNGLNNGSGITNRLNSGINAGIDSRTSRGAGIDNTDFPHSTSLTGNIRPLSSSSGTSRLR